VNRTETVAGGFFLATWVIAALFLAGWIEPPGWRLTFYAQFALAASWGWVVGNLYVIRRRTIPAEDGFKRRLFLLLYLGLPAGLLAAVRSMMDPELRAVTPLAEPLSAGIYLIFFLVPFSLRRR
jgi:hypothetical protein